MTFICSDSEDSAVNEDVDNSYVEWQQPVAVEGMDTSDGRRIEDGALTWQLPLPIIDGDEQVGRVESMWRAGDGYVIASGRVNPAYADTNGVIGVRADDSRYENDVFVVVHAQVAHVHVLRPLRAVQGEWPWPVGEPAQRRLDGQEDDR